MAKVKELKGKYGKLKGRVEEIQGKENMNEGIQMRNTVM